MILAALPLSLRLPLLAAIIVFAAATGTTHLALYFKDRAADRQTERLAQVYLDGLAAAIADDAAAGNWAAVERRFAAAFGVQEGVAEAALLALDRNGASLASVDHGAIRPPAGLAAARIAYDETARLLWAARALPPDGANSLVVALNIGPVRDAQRNLLLAVIALDFAIALICGIGAYLLLRRINRTADGVLALLQSAGTGAVRRVPAALVADADARTAPLLAAYNRMADALAEREKLRADIAERGQAAALGRLAATMAHEVRNPLGGLATAVATLRKFGDDPKVRADSLEFVARGIDTIDAIVSRIMNFHRPEDERRLTRADFDDLRLLLTPALRNRDLRLDWRVDIPDALALGASGVRQVLLNLLLNACAASPQGGTVAFTARTRDGNLHCTIADQGPGMDDSRIEQLLGRNTSSPGAPRLGLDAVVSLLGDLEGVARVERGTTGGTTVAIAIPLRET